MENNIKIEYIRPISLVTRKFVAEVVDKFTKISEIKHDIKIICFPNLFLGEYKPLIGWLKGLPKKAMRRFVTAHGLIRFPKSKISEITIYIGCKPPPNVHINTMQVFIISALIHEFAYYEQFRDTGKRVERGIAVREKVFGKE